MDPSKHIATLILSSKKGEKNGAVEEVGEVTEEGSVGLAACMEEMFSAMESGDFEEAAKAFESAFSVLEAAPHEEAEHEEE